MFVRCKRRFKDGKEHRYWSVAENVRVRGRRVVQRHVLYLGEINDSQRAAWCRSIEVVEGKSRSRQMALFPGDRDAPALTCEVVKIKVSEVSLHDPRQWGACWLAILRILACYRLIDPGSEWRLHRHWHEHSALRDLLGSDRAIADDTLYRCLDKLPEHKQDFFSFLRARWATLFGAHFDVLLYDLTREVGEPGSPRDTATEKEAAVEEDAERKEDTSPPNQSADTPPEAKGSRKPVEPPNFFARLLQALASMTRGIWGLDEPETAEPQPNAPEG